MQLTSFQDLLKLLDEEKLPHRSNPQLQFAEIPTRAPPLEGSMAIVWDRHANLVQFIHILPFQLVADRVSAVEEAVARINHVLELPGFGIDHDKLRVYYRIVLPRAKDGSIDSTIVGPALISVVNTARDFLIPLQQVALHGASPGDVVERARAARGVGS